MSLTNSRTSLLDCKTAYKNWLQLAVTVFNNSRFRLLDNKDFHTIEYHTQQVIILPVVDNIGIILCRVFRQPLGQGIWELPAGGVEDGESTEQGALREFREETGIQVHEHHRLKPLPSLIVSPNRLPMFPSIFKLNLDAKEFENRLPHDNEIECVELFSFSQIQEMIITNKIFATIPLSILSRFLLSR
jgi:8-oxo-dGTP pyrophosphatase MutT (NUDIX family)